MDSAVVVASVSCVCCYVTVCVCVDVGVSAVGVRVVFAVVGVCVGRVGLGVVYDSRVLNFTSGWRC